MLEQYKGFTLEQSTRRPNLIQQGDCDGEDGDGDGYGNGGDGNGDGKVDGDGNGDGADACVVDPLFLVGTVEVCR